jgi:hypothetical protein
MEFSRHILRGMKIAGFIADVVAYKHATGISDYELGRLAGISESMLRRIDFDRVLEKGAPGMTLRTAHRIEDAMRRFPPP